MPELPQAYLVHDIDGRSRIRVPTWRGDADYFTEAAHALGAGTGVTTVEANALTGGILIIHDTDADALARLGEAAGLFHLDKGPPPGPALPPSGRLLAGIAGIDRRITEATERRADLGSLLAAMLLIVAAVQLARGRFAIPALSALSYAFGAMSLGTPLEPGSETSP